MPQNIEALIGSCVTIPCSFDVDSNFETYLKNKDCKKCWSKKTCPTEIPALTATKEMTGNLTKKDCTTTFNNVRFAQSSKYFLRVQCGDKLRWSFSQAGVTLSFTGKFLCPFPDTL